MRWWLPSFIFVFFLNGPIQASFYLFSFFSHSNSIDKLQLNNISWKSIDGVLGTWTRGGRMEGADKSTELWRHPPSFIFVMIIFTKLWLLLYKVFRALYDYQPVKADELRLQKGELYVVMEKCEDGWFKGSSLNTLKTGVFPGNYMQHVRDDALTSSAAAATRWTTTTPSPQHRPWHNVESLSTSKTSDLVNLCDAIILTIIIKLFFRKAPQIINQKFAVFNSTVT